MTPAEPLLSSWYEATAIGRREHPPLTGAATADIGIVGGGYTGLSAALHLAGRGYSVALLEAERLGYGASGRNGGQVGTGQRREERDLEAQFGPETARRLFGLAEDAKALVRDLVARHGIPCDLRDGQIIAASRPAHARDLQDRAAHLARDYGYGQMSWLSPAELRERVAAVGYHGGCLDTGAFHLHPLNFALGLAAAAVDSGARIHEHSRVLGWSGEGPVRVQTVGGELTCRHLVLACNAYLGDLAPALAGHFLPINNYLLATAPLGVRLEQVLRGGVCVHDSRFVLNYFRPTPDSRLIFGGGETYGTRFPADVGTFVRRYLLRVFPQLADVRIDHAWGGTLAITMSRFPHLGRLSPHVYFAQGYSGHGISTATLAGQLIAEAVAGEAERFDLFARRPPAPLPGGTWLRRPAMTLGMLWYALRDRL